MRKTFPENSFIHHRNLQSDGMSRYFFSKHVSPSVTMWRILSSCHCYFFARATHTTLSSTWLESLCSKHYPNVAFRIYAQSTQGQPPCKYFTIHQKCNFSSDYKHMQTHDHISPLRLPLPVVVQLPRDALSPLEHVLHCTHGVSPSTLPAVPNTEARPGTWITELAPDES